MRIRIFVGALSVLAASCAYAGDQTWIGVISDKMCGADHKSMGEKLSDRDCTLACAKGGTPYVLLSGGHLYQLTNHEADLRTHAGHTVNLTGGLKGDTIRVSKIGMPKDSK